MPPKDSHEVNGPPMVPRLIFHWEVTLIIDDTIISFKYMNLQNDQKYKVIYNNYKNGLRLIN